MKERVVALLNFRGVYDLAVVTNPSRLQSMAKHLKNEMDHAKTVRSAALDAKHSRQESRQHKNVRQEGALGALPQGYGVKPPRVAGTNDELLLRNQDACDLLAQIPRSQNDHFRPIVLVSSRCCPRRDGGNSCSCTRGGRRGQLTPRHCFPTQGAAGSPSAATNAW
jgi:hypothetical protein